MRPNLNLQQMPGWLQTNPHIKASYRPAGLESYSYCFRSIFHLHCETINIWTHLTAFLWYTSMIADIWRNFDGNNALGSQDVMLISCLYLSWMVTWILSTLYHCLMCHSEHVYHMCYKLDISGIILSFTVTANVFIYYAFGFERAIMIFYFSEMTCMGLMARARVAKLGISRSNSNLVSLITLAGIWSVAVAHFVIGRGINSATAQIIESYCKMSLANGVGFVAYFGKLPERYLPAKPAIFNIFPHGHQIMHMATTIGGWYAIKIVLLAANVPYF